MGIAQKAKGGKGYMKLLKQIVRELSIYFVMLSTYAVVLVTGSYLVYPKLSRNICIVDPKMNTHLEDIDEVLEAFKANGIIIEKSCEDFTSINLKSTTSNLSEQEDVLAVTHAYGLALTYHASDSLGQKKEVYQVFVPMILFHNRSITMDLSNEHLDQKTFQLTLIHELGHALGAAHIYTDHHHIMYPYISATDTEDLELAVQQVKELTDYLQRYDE